MNRSELCVCGHWDSRHKPQWNEADDAGYYPCSVASCDCPDMETDWQATREAENEAKEK